MLTRKLDLKNMFIQSFKNINHGFIQNCLAFIKVFSFHTYVVHASVYVYLPNVHL